MDLFDCAFERMCDFKQSTLVSMALFALLFLKTALIFGVVCLFYSSYVGFICSLTYIPKSESLVFDLELFSIMLPLTISDVWNHSCVVD